MGSVRAITLSNKVGTLQAQVEATQKQKAQPIDANRKYDYKLQYYLNDYVYAYFTLPQEGDKQQAQVEHLNSSITSFQTLKHKVKCVTQVPCSTHN